MANKLEQEAQKMESPSINKSQAIYKPTREHLLLFAYFAVCALILRNFLPISWSNDAETVIAIARGEIATEGTGSYYLTALIFGTLGDFSITLILIIGYMWARELSWYVKSKISVLMIVICTMPGVLMGMIQPQKDVFFGLVIFYVLWIARKYKEDSSKIIYGWILGYAIYGIAMRQYFILILILFLLSLSLRKVARMWFIWLFIICLIGTMIVDREYMIMIQGTRDEVNFFRGVDEQQRTAFVNPYPQIENFLQFWGNYFYAFYRLNIPIIEFPKIQGIILQFIVIFYLYLTLIALSIKNSQNHRNMGLLFLVHFIFYPMFEPDLGSYLRHLSISAAYLSPAILILSTRISASARYK